MMFTVLFSTQFLWVVNILFAFMIITEHTDTVFISTSITFQRYFFLGRINHFVAHYFLSKIIFLA